MKCEVVSIGTEITTGQNLDTNSQWLSRELAAAGVEVGFHTTVADRLEDNIDVIRAATRRAKLVVITGGLGPTLDDLTREALAAVAGVKLKFHEPSYQTIAEMFARRGRPMPERNRVQAMVPETAEPIPNANGTAPGIWMRIGEAYVAALPGVPREMKAMFIDWVMPRLHGMGLAGGVIVERRINTFGAGESQVEELLADVTVRGRDPEVGITASSSIIHLRIVARAPNREAALAKIAPVETIIRSRLGGLVFGVDDEALEDAVARLLAEHGVTLATAESITAGQVTESLARVPGISQWLRGGVVAYQSAVKNRVLGVDADLLETSGAVSGEVAEAMARNVRELMQAGLAVSTTGLAGPGDGGEGKPVGTVYVGLAWAGGSLHEHVQWFGSRTEIQGRSAKTALDLVRRALAGMIPQLSARERVTIN